VNAGDRGIYWRGAKIVGAAFAIAFALFVARLWRMSNEPRVEVPIDVENEVVRKRLLKECMASRPAAFCDEVVRRRSPGADIVDASSL